MADRKYRWGDGKGKVHSISLGQHKKNVRSQRKDKRRQADIDKVLAPKGLSDIRREADTASNLRYGGEERALGLQSQQVPAWFAAYRGQVAGVAQGVNAGYQKAVDDQRAQATLQQTTAGTQQTDAAKTAQADAANRGATVDPTVQQQALQGANVNASAQNDLASLLAAQQTATGTYYGGLQAASSAAELGQQTRIGNDRRDLAADKGLYKSQYVSEGRDKEHTKSLERQAYGLDVQKAADDAADDRRDARQKRRDARQRQRDKNEDQRLAAGKFRSAEEKDDYQRRNKLGPYKPPAKPGAGGLTPAQQKAQKEKSSKQTTRITDAEGRWNLYKDTTVTDQNDKKRKPTPSEIKQRLIKEGFSTQEIHLALMWSSTKPWTAKDRATARRLGIRLPRKKKAKPVKITPGLLNPVD
jgi:hypothetical protein